MFNSCEDWIVLFLKLRITQLKNIGFQQKQVFKQQQLINFNSTQQLLYSTVQYFSYINKSTFFSPIYTFSLAGNIVVFTPSWSTNRGKYFSQKNYKDKRCQLWRKINTFPSISSLTGYVFSIFRREKYEPYPSQMDNKVLIPAPTQ